MRIDLNPDITMLEIFKEKTHQERFPQISGISIDSREIKKGDLYIALPGERVDGHNFLGQAFENGASAALVSKRDQSLEEFTQILVDSPLKTIGAVAKEWRSNFNIPVIGITGSNGKTSTKDLLGHILGAEFKVHATKGNQNTTISLPLTVLGLSSEHSISVLEMGASAPGEIEYLSSISRPTHGLITNIAPAHLEGFGSIDAIIREKGALFEALKDGTAFINMDDENLKNITVPGRKITFGTRTKCDYRYEIDRLETGYRIAAGGISIDTSSMNMSFVKNCMAVTTMALDLGMHPDRIQEYIQTSAPLNGRCEVRRIGSFTIIDDTYNANLQSVKAALDFLINYPGNYRRIFIFGDMKELGNKSREHHAELGEYAQRSGIDGLITIGIESKHTSDSASRLSLNRHFDSQSDLNMALSETIKSGDLILLKGSRSMKMENIIKYLEHI